MTEMLKTEKNEKKGKNFNEKIFSMKKMFENIESDRKTMATFMAQIWNDVVMMLLLLL